MTEQTHLRASLWVMAGFIAMGLGLEAMIGLRAGGFVDDAVRRDFFRLGHAHGGLLGLLNVALAWAMQKLGTPDTWSRWVRPAALAGAVLVGLGFLGGGAWHGPTDPGPLVLVVPAGAMMVIASVVVVALVRKSG